MSNCAPCNDPRFLSFNRVCHYGRSNVIRRLEVGLKYFYEWALLGIGAYTDVFIDMPTADGGNASLLKVANAPGYTDGQAWESFRTDWVYETGVVYTDITGGLHSPTTPPEIYVNSILQSTGVYNINYPLGQVIFNASISTASTVKAAFSLRGVQVYISHELPWYQELQYKSWNPDAMFTQDDRGDWFVPGNHRVQMPCIVIQAIEGGTTEPYALGGAKIIRKQSVFFHVFAEDKPMRDNLVDLLVEEGDRCVQLFDIDAAAAAQDIPLDFNGQLVGEMYPNLLANYCWANARTDKAHIFSLNSFNCGLHDGTVKHTYSVTFCNLC